MASAHHARGRSRERSERYTSDQHAAQRNHSASVQSTPRAGTKRLFSNRESRQLPRDEITGEHTEGVEDGGERHSEKRHRSSDWPLANTNSNTNASPSSVLSARRAAPRKTPNSPSSGRRSRAPIGPSKFVEGSMNDRVSARPPIPYLETSASESEFLSQYDSAGCGENGRGRKLTRGRMFTHANTSTAESSANQSDASRSSSIFRFGKSIAASFNPTNWRFWGKEQHAEEEDEEAAQLRVLQERQAKAEKIYQELKESGHFRDSAVGPRHFQPASERKPKHDSGIEFGDVDVSGGASSGRGSTSIDEKRKGRVYLEPPRLQQRGESPASMSNRSGSLAPSNTSTPNGKPKFRKPSLANLKRVSLSNIKNSFADSSLSVNEHQARRIPSRKDLHKQQKLVKRVSNLEERLKQARQQLADALNEPLPTDPPASQVSFASHASSKVGRARFVPGAMPSLPSERLLSGYVSSEASFSDGEMEIGIGQAVTTDDEVSEEVKTVEYTSVSLQRQDGTEDHVLQSVEDQDALLQEAIEGQFADADITPTKPVSSFDDEATPRPKPAESTKKRKSIFDRAPDDGGDYIPFDASDSAASDLDDVISDVSSISKPPKSTIPKPSSGTQRAKGPTITLTQPRKLQKTGQGTKGNSAAVPTSKKPPSAHNHGSAQSSPVGKRNMPPPTRAAPPPPPPGNLGRSPSKKPVSSPHPSSRLVKKSLVPAPGTSRQQSASPPPSSITFSGPGLNYTKPSAPKSLEAPNLPKASTPTATRHQEGYVAYPALSPSIPPLPPMPKAVRLASGEVISTENNVAVIPAGPKPEQATGMTTSVSKQSFEWPDDVF